MSQQYINIGATPNDGLGDPIRTAFQKTNENFSELYANSGNGGGNANTGNVTFDNINIIGTGNLHLQPDPANTGSYLDIFLTSGPDLHLVASAAANLILGKDDGANVMTSWNGNVYIQSWTRDFPTHVGGVWTFGYDGNLTAPGNINFSTTSANIIAGNALGNLSGVGDVVGFTNGLDGDGYENYFVLDSGGNLHIGQNTGVSSGALIWDGGGSQILEYGGAGLTLRSYDGSVLINSLIGGPATLNIDGDVNVGNVYSGNIINTGTSSSTGNINGGNILTAGYVSATGNITAGNIATIGNVTATGNIQANYFIGNGAFLTGISGGGTPNANSLTGNTLNSNVVISSLTQVGTLANLSVSGNTTSGNFAITGSGGNITGANVISATTFTASGNIKTAGTVSATGNITTAGYFIGTFQGNVSGNIVVPGSNTQVLYNNNGNAGASAGFTFNAGTNALATTGTISALGNVTATNFIGNLSNGNSKISIASSGNITVGIGPFDTTVLNINTSTGISVLGNVVASQTISAVGNVYSNGNIAMVSNLPRNTYVANVAPTVGQGNIGDIWYQTF